MNAHRRKPAVFFDRDGTLNQEVEGALCRVEQLRLLPGAAQAIVRAREAGFATVVLTNQSAIARGWMTPFELEVVHAELSRRLAAEGASLDGIWHCPHLDVDGFAPYRRGCACRKPAPGLLLEAARKLDLDLANSWVIGDALRDVAAATAVGAKAVLVRSGKGEREWARAQSSPQEPQPSGVADTVLAAVELLLAQGK